MKTKKLNLKAGDRVVYVFDKMHAGYRKGRKVGGVVIDKGLTPFGLGNLYTVNCDDGRERRIAEDWLRAV